MKNDHLVKAALKKQENIMDLEKRLEVAKDEYSEAVRKMHEHAMSYREIAVKLGVSHQRIHQLVTQQIKKHHSWIQLVDYNLNCSFCGKANTEVAKLVAGSKTFICDVCAKHCSTVLETNKSVKINKTAFKLLDESVQERCSFCDKASRNRIPVVGTKDHQMCATCLESVMNCLKSG